MVDWLDSVSTPTDATLTTLATRLLLAWLGGWLVSRLARMKQPVAASDTLTLTLILMSILIAMATQIIGDNIARAFSLVGALSIVRFRTAVPVTRDVAFVLAAVVVGMACGAGQYWVAALGLVTVGLATQMTAALDTSAERASEGDPAMASERWRLTMTIGLHAVDGWESELTRLTKSFRLISAETARRGGALELVYQYQPSEGCDAVKLIAALNAIPTVESVSAKQC